MPRVRGMHGKRLDDAIGRVESLVLRVLRGIADTVARLVGGSPSTAALSDDDLRVIRREWETAVGAEIVPALSEAYVESATHLAKEFADAGRPVEVVSLEAPSAADFLEAATNRLAAVSDTLWEVARKELADGVRAGEGIEELAARLQEAGGFGEARARMIARTECVAAANAASLAQALRLGDPSMTKTWEDADDERVRPAHALADGQTVPVGEPFEVGGESLMYPGQPIGSAGNVINERCTQVYGWDDVDEPLTASGPDGFHLPGRHDQDEHGKDRGGAPDVAKSRVRDPLKLAARIRLKPGETFTGSDTIAASEGRINLAWIDRGGERHLRFAAGRGAFDDEAHRWRAENKGFTADLDPTTTAALRDELGRMVDEAKRATVEVKRLNRDYDRFYGEHGEEPREREASEAWRGRLPAEAKAALSDLDDRAERLTDNPVVEGSVNGAWADVRFQVQMDEVSESPGWHLIIGVRPKDAADDWTLRDGVHDAWLSPAQTRRLAKLLTAADTASGARSQMGSADAFHLPGKHDQSEHGKDGPNAPDSSGNRSSSGGGVAASAGRDRTSIGETVRKYGSKSLTLGVHEDGQLSLTDNDGNKIRLSRADVDQLRTDALYSYDMQVGDEFAITHREERDGALHSSLRLLVRKTAAVPDDEIEEGEESYLRDTLAVHLAPNDDPDFDQLRGTPPVEMTARELADLAQALTDLETAGRVDTGHGQLDMFSDGRNWVLRPVDGPELRLNRRGFRALDQALDAVVEELENEDGTRSGGPLGEDGTVERTVDTNIGQVTVSLKGGLGVGDLTIRVPDHDVEIVVAPAQQSTFFEQLGSLSEVLTASAARRKRNIMSPTAPLEVVTAAAEVHTGAMVALRPSAADAERLAVEGGEPADQLHTTLAYLGTAADIPVEAQEAIIDAIFDVADGMPPLTVEGFAVSAFNPGDANDRDPCIVLGLSGEGLDDIHGQVVETLANLQSEPAGFKLPEQHTPWQPHVTLIYTDDVSMVEKLADRVGPVTFDAIRVAFAGEVFDIPLGEPEGDEGDGEEDDDFDWDAYVTQAIQAQFQSRMPPQLQRFWIRRLRLGTKGSFRRCVRELREYFPEDTEGLCANLYHEATGRWPGRKKDNAALADVGGEAREECPPGHHRMPDGECMPDADMATVEDTTTGHATVSLDAEPGEHFHTRVLEGVSTGMREFAPGAITWRTPPFAYHWQWKSSAHNGVPETIQVGLITRAERAGDNVHFWGRLDLRSPEGLDYARRLVEGFARWSSVGADESVKDRDIDVEYILDSAEPGDVDAEPEVDVMTFNAYRVAEISGVSVPALADATVEPTQELIDTLTEMGVIDQAQVASEPPAVEEIQEDEVADFAAVRPHDTPTTDGKWDAGANEKRLPSPLPVSTAREEFAYVDDSRVEGDHIPKDACALPHHEVSEDGRVGAANVDAVRNALARLSETQIPESEREAVHAHLARHLEDAGGSPSEFAVHGPSVVVASGRTITLPEAPPAAWFDEPADDELPPYGSVRVDAHGRLVGLLAPAQVNHRSFPGKRVKVPMGNVDYSGWMNKAWQVAEGTAVNVGVITMDCGHASTNPGDWSYSNRREHYDNTCSIAAHARAYEKPGVGVALAGAIAPWLDAEGFQKLLSADLSGDWPPHPDRPGWRDFTAALAVPVGGFPNRARLRVKEGALVAAAVPVHFDDNVLVEIEEDETPALAEGTRVRVVDPRDPEVTEGQIAMVHTGPAYALMVPGSEEPRRWYVAEEIEPVGITDEPDEVEGMVAAAGPDLRPALDFVARKVGRDPQSRMDAIRARVKQPN